MATGPRLRVLLTRLTVAITALTLFAALALSWMTTRMQRIGSTTSAAVESVRLGHEAQINLMLYERADDPIVRSELAADLRRNLAQAVQHVASPAEGELLDAAVVGVNDYLRGIEADLGPGELTHLEDVAYAALRSLVDHNVLDARAARDLSTRWDALANVLAVLLASITLALGAAFVWWVRTRTVEPLLALSATLDRFGRGQSDARALESGPHEVREMARRFNTMAEALAQQRSAQMTHLAAVAHDLRNPLWSIQVSLKAAAAVAPGDPRGRRGLEVAERQVSRLGRMIDDLLDASHIEAGRLELRCAPHDLGVLVRELAEQFDGRSAKHPVHVRVPAQSLTATVDPVRIGQVVTNLMTNAIKYSPEGGAIEVTVDARDGAAAIDVVDHGVGIARADVERLFEPFHRLSGTRGISGSGLGLFIVRRVVEAHGGTIEVTSEPGCGSRFCVRLPLLRGTTTELTLDDAGASARA